MIYGIHGAQCPVFVVVRSRVGSVVARRRAAVGWSVYESAAVPRSSLCCDVCHSLFPCT